MKLKCEDHGRRVMVISATKVVQDSIQLVQRTVHREDGSHCDSGFLKYGNQLTQGLQVALRRHGDLPVKSTLPRRKKSRRGSRVV